MKTAVLLLTLLALPGGERERGLALYREGRFAEAAAAFRAAIAEDGDSAELQWNLALASWRAGDLATAETAVEKYAAMERHARTDLHAGLLGAVRHDEAMALTAQADAGAAQGADPLPQLEQALAKAQQARDHFVRGATAAGTPELLRNVERSLRTIAGLERRIEELKRQREQQPDQQQDRQQQQQQQDEAKQDAPKPDQQPDGRSDERQQPQLPDQGAAQEQPQPQSEPQTGENQERPEPKPEGQQGEGQERPEAGADQPAEAGPSDPPQPTRPRRQDAPGEGAEGRELTPEQTQRLLELLRELDQRQQAIRARAKSGRRPVERDW
jgi:Ca-activated chloride channel family protein